MSPILSRLIALVVLLTQGVVALVPGRVVCIPVRDRAEHQHAAGEVCGHDAWDACCPTEQRDGCGATSDRAAASGSESDCDCCVDMPAPGDDRVPTRPAGDVPEFRAAPAVVAAVLHLHVAPEREMTCASLVRPPDVFATDRVRGLKSMRLIL